MHKISSDSRVESDVDRISDHLIAAKVLRNRTCRLRREY